MVAASKDGPGVCPSQVRKKEEALDLIAAYPDEMLQLMEQVDKVIDKILDDQGNNHGDTDNQIVSDAVRQQLV